MSENSAKRGEITKIDLSLVEQKENIRSINYNIQDFEKRIRELETFKNKSQGFAQANKYWITIGLVTLINIIIAVSPYIIKAP